jgi:hypothetical protein
MNRFSDIIVWDGRKRVRSWPWGTIERFRKSLPLEGVQPFRPPGLLKTLSHVRGHGGDSIKAPLWEKYVYSSKDTQCVRVCLGPLPIPHFPNLTPLLLSSEFEKSCTVTLSPVSLPPIPPSQLLIRRNAGIGTWMKNSNVVNRSTLGSSTTQVSPNTNKINYKKTYIWRKDVTFTWIQNHANSITYMQ